MVLLVTHVGEGGIGSRTRREDSIVSDVGDSGIVSDTRRGGWHC